MTSEAKFKTIKILLHTNIKDHRDIIYKPNMTIPYTRSSLLYVMPTVPIDMTDIKRLDPKYNDYLSSKLASQRSVSDEDFKYADLKADNIIDVFLNPKALVDIVQKKIDYGFKTGRPVAPKQFKKSSDLLNGELIKLNNRIIFRKSGKYLELHKTEPHALNFIKGFTIGKVDSNSSFNIGGLITVYNEFPPTSSQHRKLSFINSVIPLTLSQAHEKGYVNDNIRFIINLLFNSKRKFYYNGNEKLGFPIHSYQIEQHNNQRIWQISNSDPHTLIVTVNLLLLPLIPFAMKKNQFVSNNKAMDCIFRKEAIITNFHSLFGNIGNFNVNSDALVEIPKNLRTDMASGQARLSRPPMQLRPQSIGGNTKRRRTNNKKTKKRIN